MANLVDFFGWGLSGILIATIIAIITNTVPNANGGPGITDWNIQDDHTKYTNKEKFAWIPYN